VKFLLDTHLVLWIPVDDPKISREARAILSDPSNECIFSVASIWEIAIKKRLGRPDFPHDPREIRALFLQNGYQELPIESRHAVLVDSIALIHKDPFDRILIAQSMAEGITLLTADPEIASYPGPIRKI